LGCGILFAAPQDLRAIGVLVRLRDNSPHRECGGLPHEDRFVRCSSSMAQFPADDDREHVQIIDASAAHDRALSGDDDLPVVARLVVEIRSDGRRTVARGAIEDVASGAKTAVVARGESPVRLAVDLARAIARLPRMAARSAFKSLRDRREQ
jgi:hypothetical protein